MIERGHFGGTCVNVGCIPTKTMVASARAVHVAQARRANYGFSAGDVQVNMARVKARKDELVHDVAQRRSAVDAGVEANAERAFSGQARIRRARARSRWASGCWRRLAIFINVGGRAAVPRSARRQSMSRI